MTSKQRVLTALEHKEPDRIPVDFGATSVTGIHVSCVAALRDYYGLEKRPVRVHEPHQMLGWLNEDLKQAMGLDVEGLLPRKTAYGFANEDWKPWRTLQGLEVLVPGNFNTTVDPEGYTLIYPEGDTTAPPSGRMPQDGYFFDTIIRQEPIDDDKLDPEDNLEEFGPISEEDLAHIRAEAARAAATGRAVIAKFNGLGLGDIAAVTAPFLKRPRGIRDITEWYVSTRTRRQYIHAVFSKQTEFALANLERIHAAIGDSIDVLYTCGTDFGTQRSTLCSAETFRDLYLPYYKLVNDWVHRNTSWKTFKHSCGAVEKFMSYFIEAGFEIINPVQCSAAGMEPGHLKSAYGDRLVFWGGGVDTQKTLPFGVPSEVREQVLRRCEIFSKGGGFVFNTVHNIQAQTPVANIIAMFDALREFQGRT
jgi:uroporphyrinogen-III decarboxylase